MISLPTPGQEKIVSVTTANASVEPNSRPNTVTIGIEISRSLIGPYITSLEMQGCSITLLKLDDEMIRYWDAPVNTPGLRWGV